MSERLVAVEKVSYQVGPALLIDDVSVHVEPGEFVGLIGPNGAGKSTLLSLMAGSLQPTAGAVNLHGVTTADLSPRDLALARAMLGSNPPTDVPFTVQTVVEAGRHPYRSLPDHDSGSDEAVIARALAMAHVDHLADRFYPSLSSGEQARVMIARVLAQDAPISLLDEPTASLDVANAESAMAALNRDLGGSSVVCVLHDLNQASYHCDRLVLLDAGRVVSTGPPEKVLDPDALSAVYGQQMSVVGHPFRDCPLVLVGGPTGMPRT